MTDLIEWLNRSSIRESYRTASKRFGWEYDDVMPLHGEEAQHYWIEKFSKKAFEGIDRLNLLLPLIKFQVEHDMLTEWMREELQLYFEDYAAGRLTEQLIPEEADEVIADLLACHRAVFGPVDPKRYANEPPKPRRRVADRPRPENLPIRYDEKLKDDIDDFASWAFRDGEEFQNAGHAEAFWLWECNEVGFADAEELNFLLPLMWWQAERRSYTPLVLHDVRSYYEDYLNGSLRPILAHYEADAVIDLLCRCYETIYGTKELVDEPIPPGVPGRDYEIMQRAYSDGGWPPRALRKKTS